jgi:hypothetical protein
MFQDQDQDQAFGDNSQAFGDNSQAFGDNSQAFGDNSQAFGDNSQAFDFTLSHYSTEELLRFLGLPSKYTYNDVMVSYQKMIRVIDDFQEFNKSKSYKKNLGVFIEQAKTRILENIVKTTQEEDDLLEDFDELMNTSEKDNIVNTTSVTYGGHHFVQNKETISFNEAINREKRLDPIEAYPTNISRSVLNNLKRKTIRQTVIFNSLYREDYNKTLSTNFTLFLPSPIKNVFSVRLSSIQLPNVLYCISQRNRNNTFYIEEENTAIACVIVIPDGNYTPEQFCSTLQSLITTHLQSEDRFSVSIDPYTLKLTIANTTNVFRLHFAKEFNPYNNSTQHYEIHEEYKKNSCPTIEITEMYKRLGWIMGFREIEYKNKQSYTTEGIYNGISTNYLYFTMNDYNHSQSQNILGMFSQSMIIDNILAMIPINQSPTSLNTSFTICFNSGDDFIEKKREYFGPVNIQKVKFQLLNQYGEVIDLNCMDFSFSLEFEVAYDW